MQNRRCKFSVLLLQSKFLSSFTLLFHLSSNHAFHHKALINWIDRIHSHRSIGVCVFVRSFSFLIALFTNVFYRRRHFIKLRDWFFILHSRPFSVGLFVSIRSEGNSGARIHDLAKNFSLGKLTELPTKCAKKSVNCRWVDKTESISAFSVFENKIYERQSGIKHAMQKVEVSFAEYKI